MTRPRTELPIALLVAALGVVAPLLLPALTIQFAFLWVMVVFALSWDVLGGQMGYNSFGNVVFFGIGMYVCAVIQVAPFTDLAEYTSASGTQDIGLSHAQYFTGLAIGCLVGALAAVAVALTVLYGVADETHQAFVPGRVASEADLAIDASGAMTGVFLAILAPKLRKTHHARSEA